MWILFLATCYHLEQDPADLPPFLYPPSVDNPKQIYKCDYPDCRREFVRLDLCTRHRERHGVRGVLLQRKEVKTISPILAPYSTNRSRNSMMGYPTANMAVNTNPSLSPSLSRQNSVSMNHNQMRGTTTVLQGLYSQDGVNHGGFRSIARGPVPADHPNGHSMIYSTQASVQSSAVPFNVGNRATSYGSIDTAMVSPSPRMDQPPFTPSHSTNSMQNLSLNSPRNDPSGYQNFQSTAAPYPMGLNNTGQSYVPAGDQMAQVSMGNLPPSTAMAVGQIQYVPNQQQQQQQQQQLDGNGGYASSNQMYGGQGSSAMNPTTWFNDFGDLGRSPYVQPQGVVDWLLDSVTNSQRGSMVMEGMQEHGLMTNWADIDPSAMNFPLQQGDAQHAMAITHITDTMQESLISEERRLKLLQYMDQKFNEEEEAAIVAVRHSLFAFPPDSPDHLLDLPTMRTYVQAYWNNFHFQIPILHKPTFMPNTEHDILLLTVMAIGACCLDKSHGALACEIGAQIADFIAWHLRWEIFRSRSSRPPADLFILQSLILLEVYEKMFATKILHERAHIHHAATITTLRRSSALQGKRDDGGPTSLKPQRTLTAREQWLAWIELEATKRVVFATFLIDSLHAAMFGHNSMMVVHEMRLTMPCDEKCWNAKSAQELSFLENRHRAEGKKATNFLDSLKSTINNRQTRTSSFGRSILMAGLLSVCWHLFQRDLLENSTGPIPGAGTSSLDTEKWQTSLTRAFDCWRRHFDEAIQENAANSIVANNGGGNNTGTNNPSSGSPSSTPISAAVNSAMLPPPPAPQAEEYPVEENLFETRTVLHHLAHLAHNADIVTVQVLTGAHRLLGRQITVKDQRTSAEKMRRWARSGRARDATLYAIKLLKQVLLPNEPDSTYTNQPVLLVGGPQAGSYVRNMTEYQASKDFLLNRPWVLYFAALVLWAYAYMSEGPLLASDVPTEAQLAIDGDTAWHDLDLRRYMTSVGSAQHADELGRMRGLNRMVGLLRVMQRMCRDGSRWELLHEGAKRLDDCVRKLVGLEARGGGEGDGSGAE